MTGKYVIWNNICQSVESGEDDEGWPSYEAALSACVEGSDMPAWHGPNGLVFGANACAKAEAAFSAAAAQAEADSARRAATVASLAAEFAAKADAAKAADPSADQRRAAMLAANQASLTAELAKRKPDQAELARLQANIKKLSA